jgi:hypothetical protein
MVFFQPVHRAYQPNPRNWVRFAGDEAESPSSQPTAPHAKRKPASSESASYPPSLPRHLSGPQSLFWNPWRQVLISDADDDTVVFQQQATQPHSANATGQEPASQSPQPSVNATSGASTPPASEADSTFPPLTPQPRRNAVVSFMPTSAPSSPIIPYYGYGWGWYAPPESEVKLNVTGDYYAGFEPKTTIQKLFGVNRSPAAMVIDNPDTLATVWAKTGMPDSEMPPVDWDKEALVLVTRERSAGTSSIPESMAYSRHNRRLEIKLADERKPGRNPGVAWYLGKVSNAEPTDEQKRKHADWKKLDNTAWASFQTVSPD